MEHINNDVLSTPSKKDDSARADREEHHDLDLIGTDGVEFVHPATFYSQFMLDDFYLHNSNNPSMSTTALAEGSSAQSIPYTDEDRDNAALASFYESMSEVLPSSSDLQPLSSHVSSAENNSPTIWTGINNFLSNFSNSNVLKPKITNIASYLSHYLPNRLNASNNPQQRIENAGLWQWLRMPEQTPGMMFSSRALMNPDEGMQIRVLGVPASGAKSRVETQIKLCLQLVTHSGDKAHDWTVLKLPERMVTRDRSTGKKNKHHAKASDTTPAVSDSSRTLYLQATVTCASDPKRTVSICKVCIQRERKRLQRRKDKIPTSENDPQQVPDEERVLLFSCSDSLDFSSGDAILPTRITCYCRHHNERIGFCIRFEMKDFEGKTVAKGVSPPIMITDDHKSNKLRTGMKRQRSESEQPTGDNLLENSPEPKAIKIEHVPQPYIPNINVPQIQRIVPEKLPTRMGSEVTILGSGFYPGLTCMFDNVAATSTFVWSSNVIICQVPPMIRAGSVTVTFLNQPIQVAPMSLHFQEDNERSLLELALQVVGMKTTGRVEEAKDVARRIVARDEFHYSKPTHGIP